MRVALAAVAAYAVARGVKAAVKARPDAFSSWERPSYTGARVSLTEGLASVGGLLAGASFIPGKRRRTGAFVGITAAGVAGAIDDHWEHAFPAEGKGFSGHLKALKEGKLTSGVVKIATIGSGSALCALGLSRSAHHPVVKVTTWAGQTALIAGTANLVNLLDLRPGRALKVCLVGATIGLVCPKEKNNEGTGERCLYSTVCGAAIAVLPDDLAGRTMLGDLGANALGALLGSALAGARPCIMWPSLLTVLALTLVSEKYSFSAVIEANPVLSALDQFGRS